jgi:integrase/recombinase XerD
MTTALSQMFVRLHCRYTRSAHVEDLNAFAQWLIDRRYNLDGARKTVRDTMRSLDASDLPPGTSWRPEQLLQAFRARHRGGDYPSRGHAFGMFLHSVGRLLRPQEHGPHASLLGAYRRYLSDVRGFAPTTIDQHISELDLLLERTLLDDRPLEKLSARMVECYVRRRAEEVSRRSLRNFLGMFRGFFRYCFDQGLITRRLDIIDQPARVPEELPPRALDWPLIQTFLSSIDRKDRGGWRDFMLFHIMAYYGLRPGEAVRLKVESVDWTACTLQVEQGKTRSRLMLPLLDETMDFLHRYLREGRDPAGGDELFPRLDAPHRRLSTAAVSTILKHRVRKSGLPMTHASPYAFRHSFAMRLLARNVGIKAIGDLMGHHNLASTTLYLRLQTDMLRHVALPVPTLADREGGVA